MDADDDADEEDEDDDAECDADLLFFFVGGTIRGVAFLENG